MNTVNTADEGLLAAPAAAPAAATSPPPQATAPVADGNVLLADWQGPYGGVPAFDRMDLAAVKPALEAGMAQNLAEIDAIVADPAPPTFENTILAMERAGKPLARAFTYWGIWSGNLSSPEFRAIQGEMAPGWRRSTPRSRRTTSCSRAFAPCTRARRRRSARRRSSAW